MALLGICIEKYYYPLIYSQNSHIHHMNVDHHHNHHQVFHDVHLNFEDFNKVFPSGVEVLQHHAHSAETDNMKILNSDRFVSQNDEPPPLKPISSEEVEFSDTEDMLEGIRNVVDKVSIEDTCDDIDLMTSSSMRGSW